MRQNTKCGVCNVCATAPLRNVVNNSDILVRSYKNGTNENRFVNDLRAVNKLKKAMFCPLPTIYDVLDLLANKTPRLFPNIDMKYAYFQLFLDHESRPKTGLTVNGRYYEYCRMTMGLSIQHKPGNVCWRRYYLICCLRVLLYILTTYCWYCHFPEQYKHIEMLFQKFWDANLRMNGKNALLWNMTLNISTIFWAKTESELIHLRQMSFRLGYAIKHVNIIFGMANYHKRFLNRYPQCSAPLRHLLSKDVLVQWEDAQEKLFQDLKSALPSPLILCSPDSSRPYHLQTDAS